RRVIEEFNTQAAEAHRLRIHELQPEPFLGDPAAPVLLLSNNPGFGKRAAFRQEAQIQSRIRETLLLIFKEYPFVYLDPQFHDAGWWWRQKLKCLRNDFGDEVLARSVCNIVYFPYPSTNYAHKKCNLPSQQYGFHLVREGMARD